MSTKTLLWKIYRHKVVQFFTAQPLIQGLTCVDYFPSAGGGKKSPGRADDSLMEGLVNVEVLKKSMQTALDALEWQFNKSLSTRPSVGGNQLICNTCLNPLLIPPFLLSLLPLFLSLSPFLSLSLSLSLSSLCLSLSFSLSLKNIRLERS